MGETTKIEWCDRTASPWHGCSEVHTGCDNCYARTMSLRNPKTLGVWGDNGTRVKSTSFIGKLRKWNRDGEKLGRVLSVFPSICDPFEDRPELVPWRREMFDVAYECPWIRLLLLTKRPENIAAMAPPVPISSYGGYAGTPGNEGRRGGVHSHFYRENVWIGTSISDQETADKAVPELLKCRDLSPVLFLSAEPLVGPVRLDRINVGDCPRYSSLSGGFELAGYTPYGLSPPKVDWVIVGGESGAGARPCALEWVDDLRRQCESADVSCFVKQLGSLAVTTNANLWDDLKLGRPWGESAAGAHVLTDDKKGGDWSQWPERLRVREFPTAAIANAERGA